MQVFYLDDDVDEVLLFSEALHEIDPEIHCECVTDSTTALAQLENGRTPDVIFLDFNMPGLTGEDCLTSINRMPHLSKIPVVIYSTGVTEKLAQRLLRKGAAMVVKKHATSAEFKAFFNATFLSTALNIEKQGSSAANET